MSWSPRVIVPPSFIPGSLSRGPEAPAASNPVARPKAARNAGRMREKTRRIGTSSLSFGDFAGIAQCACDAIVSPTAVYSLPARRPWRGGKVGTMKFVMAGLGLAALVSASPLLAQPASRFTLSATGSFVDTKTTAVDETNGVDIKFKNGCGARLAGTFYAVSYTHLRAHETRHDLVCRLLLEKK